MLYKHVRIFDHCSKYSIYEYKPIFSHIRGVTFIEHRSKFWAYLKVLKLFYN